MLRVLGLTEVGSVSLCRKVLAPMSSNTPSSCVVSFPRLALCHFLVRGPPPSVVESSCALVSELLGFTEGQLQRCKPVSRHDYIWAVVSDYNMSAVVNPESQGRHDNRTKLGLEHKHPSGLCKKCGCKCPCWCLCCLGGCCSDK